MGFVDKIKGRAYHAATGLGPGAMGHGPFEDANSGWVDNKPYSGHHANGLFVGYDGSVWFFMAFPEDVKVRYLRKNESVIDTQSFFLNAVSGLAGLFNRQEDKLQTDLRREFHVQVTLDVDNYRPPKGVTPAHADYLMRMNRQYTRPLWKAYLGVQLIPASLFSKKYSWRDMLKAYIDMFMNMDQVQAVAFEQDRHNVERILTAQGFKPLDFTENPEDFERLTAWYGVSDEQFGLPRQLQNIHLEVPAHQRSIFTPKWGELYLSALKPTEKIDYTDPQASSTNTRWASPLLRPGSGVVCINIRGQIRGDDVIDNLLDIKGSNKHKNSGSSTGSLSYSQVVSAGREAIKHKHFPMLDNVEIIIASQVPKSSDAETPLQRIYQRTGFEVALLEGRQDKAILSTLPAYPHHVMRVPTHNKKRPHLSNAIFPGIIAFSTLFQSDRPLAKTGIQLGLSEAQYQPIYIEIDAASRYSQSPITLVSGRPGSGKTQSMLNWIAQAVMQGAIGVYFNPKQTGTLQPMFDYLGGVTISLNASYLNANPGLADPFFFLDSRTDIASVISDAIVTALKMNEDKGTDAAQRRARLLKEVKMRCADERNRTASNVIFGNPHEGTQPISDEGVRDFITSKMETSPFWKSFIAPPGAASAIKGKIDNARAILFEWDDSMQLPDADKERSQYTDNEVDTVLSLVTMFRYGVAKARKSGGNAMIICDEAHVLKASQEAMSILDRAGREWREANILLILGTQQITDFMGDPEREQSSLSTFFSRFVMMAISENSASDFAWFYRLSDLPNENEGKPIGEYAKSRYAKEMINAAGQKTKSGKPIFRAYVVDLMYNYRGSIIVGPWPERELSIGRTDKEAKERRARGMVALDKTYEEMLDESSSSGKSPGFVYSAKTGGYSGFISDLALDKARSAESEENSATEADMNSRESSTSLEGFEFSDEGVKRAALGQINGSLTSGSNIDKALNKRER